MDCKFIYFQISSVVILVFSPCVSTLQATDIIIFFVTDIKKKVDSE